MIFFFFQNEESTSAIESDDGMPSAAEQAKSAGTEKSSKVPETTEENGSEISENKREGFVTEESKGLLQTEVRETLPESMRTETSQPSVYVESASNEHALPELNENEQNPSKSVNPNDQQAETSLFKTHANEMSPVSEGLLTIRSEAELRSTNPTYAVSELIKEAEMIDEMRVDYEFTNLHAPEQVFTTKVREVFVSSQPSQYEEISQPIQDVTKSQANALSEVSISKIPSMQELTINTPVNVRETTSTIQFKQNVEATNESSNVEANADIILSACNELSSATPTLPKDEQLQSHGETISGNKEDVMSLDMDNNDESTLQAQKDDDVILQSGCDVKRAPSKPGILFYYLAKIC